MVTTTVPALWESTPDVTPMPSSLLDHADVVDGVSWQRPTGLGLSFNCMDTNVPTALCPAPTEPKVWGAPGVIDGFEFAVYGGVACKPFGFTEEQGHSEIDRVFRLKESRGIERALMETRFIANGDLWDAASDITPASGAVSPKMALAMLEGFAASEYAGVPTVHVPVILGSLLLDGAIEMQAGKAYSNLGSKIAVGAGYDYSNSGPDGTPAAPGERWAYATGEVMIARGEVDTKVLRNTSTNDIVALAERRYIVAIDCFAVAIRVSLED